MTLADELVLLGIGAALIVAAFFLPFRKDAFIVLGLVIAAALLFVVLS